MKRHKTSHFLPCVTSMAAALLMGLTACAEPSSPQNNPQQQQEEQEQQQQQEGTFNLKQDGNVSAAIYDSTGRMVREIMRAEPMKAGKHALEWDGLDQAGQPVPAGTYEWRTLQTQGLRSEYIMSVGTSVGDRWWPGNHDGPRVVTVSQGSLIISAVPEGPPLLTRSTLDGKVIWERENFKPARSPFDMAVSGDKLYYLQDDAQLYVLDFATGDPARNPFDASFPVKTINFAQMPLVEKSDQQDTGWDTIQGLSADDFGIVSDSPQPRTFTTPMHNGQFLLRYTMGEVSRDTTVVEVQPNGREAYRGHRYVPGKMAWWQLPATKKGQAVAPIYLPQIYQNPSAVTVTDSQLQIKFIPGSPDKAPDKAHWRLNQLEVIATGDRVAALGDELVLASTGAGRLLWLDPTNGSTQDQADVAGIRDITLGSDGEVYVLLSDRVVSLTRQNKSPQTRVTGLIDPVALDIDPATGQIVVALGGEQQQVKVYGPDNNLIATHGQKGGRHMGAYDPNHFASLTGIAADGQGGFVVVEKNSAPRRTARFNAQGKVMREWFGGNDFYTQTETDPQDPTIGWVRQDSERILRVRLNYETGQWYPLAAYRWTQMWDPADITLSGVYGQRHTYGPWLHRSAAHLRMRTLRRDLDGDGKTELLIEFTAFPMLLVHDEKRDRLRPLATMGLMNRDFWAVDTEATVDELPAAWAEAIRMAGGDPADVKSRQKYANYSWADQNGDGLIDAKELRLTPAHRDASSPSMGVGGYCLRIDEDFNAWIGTSITNTDGLYSVYRPEGFTDCGAPIWPLTPQTLGTPTQRRGASTALLPANDGGAFAIVAGNGDGTKVSYTYDTAVHGWSWPSILTDGVALMRLDAQGNTLWQTSSKAARWPHPKGQLHGPWHLGGTVHDCIAVFDWVEQPCEFWTTDGLYVGGLFDGRDPHDGSDLSKPGSPADSLYTWHGIKAKRIGGNKTYAEKSPLAADDFRTGGHVAAMPDGSVMFFGQGANSNPTYRITGWENWNRQQGSIQIKQAPTHIAKAQGTGLNAEIFTDLDFSGTPVKRIDEQLWFGIKKPWPETTPSKDFSVRWHGYLEPRFTEKYCLSIYARGDFKLWIDGKPIEWSEQDYPRREINKGHSLPITLVAGKRVPITIEYIANMHTRTVHPGPSFHLNWESISQPVEHVPAAYLYPTDNAPKTQ